MIEANLQTEWSALLFASLADAGVCDVVISPGSRSTPFVVAAVREKRLRCHNVIDERAAAFFALGQARVSGRPSVLVCTSGTAPAHYLPAIIEANIMGVPLVVLSGDRPHELYDCRAPQTIDQVKLFGENVRQFFDLVPDPGETSLRALRRVGAQAVLASSWPRPGAVHINARARKPLEPVAASTPEEHALAETVRRLKAEPITAAAPPVQTAAPQSIARAVELARASRRGIIVAGPANMDQRRARESVWALATATGFPVACEATSQLRFGPKPAEVTFLDAFELILRSKTLRASAPFDFAIQIGAPPTSGQWETLAPAIPRVVLAEHGWPDPHGTAQVIGYGDVAATCRAIADALRGAAPPPAAEHRAMLRAVNEAAWAAVETVMAETGSLVEAAAVRVLLDKAPPGSLLAIGNSLAVRLVDIYGRASERDLDVLSQRGASGIDGLVAGAAGAVSAASRPLALLIGDVSLLHDLSSLAVAARATEPLVVFVLNNGGGRIFEQLPLVSVPGLEREIIGHATTPHDIGFSHAAALYGIRYARVTSAPEVAAALDAAYRHRGCTLVEVSVEPSGAIRLARSVTSAVEARVAPLVQPARA